MNFTRLNIAYIMCRLSRYTQHPNHEHWSTLAKLMKILKKTVNYGILYGVFPTVLIGYNDANRISDSIKIKSTSSYVHPWWWCNMMKISQTSNHCKIDYVVKVCSSRVDRF